MPSSSSSATASSSHSDDAQHKESNIKVAIRVRPRNTAEKKANSATVVKCDSSAAEVAVHGKIASSGRTEDRKYTFDHVFAPDCTQLEVYEGVVGPATDEVLKGYNCTVFAYGQTGTGKTFTIEGVQAQSDAASYKDDPTAGLIPRALHHLFEKLEQGKSEFSVKVSFLELYNEELYDLLSPITDNGKLRIFEDSKNKGSVVIQGLEDVNVLNRHDVYNILQKGGEKRRTAETKMNKNSSRSHSVFTITVHQKENTVDGEELVKTGKLNLVDLAGSENIGRSGAQNDRAREAGNINQSLLTLGRVINSLVEKHRHIPYRESKLTRILQDSLGGKTKTSIIATISPASINLEESLSTLQYANRAKNITNKPEVNQKLSKKALIKEYVKEIERLKANMHAAREKNGVYLTQETYDDMEATISGQKTSLSETYERIKVMEAESKKIQELFEGNKVKLEETEKELQQKTETLKVTEIDLSNTKETLATTTQDRDEQRHLVDVHARSEDILHNQAQNLVEVADETTAHVEGLHAKISRKAKVEEGNKAAASQVQGKIHSQTETLRDALSTMQSMHDSRMAVMNKLLSKFVDNHSQTVLALQDQLAGLVGQVTQGVDNAQAKIIEHFDGSRNILESHMDAHQAFSASATDAGDKFCKHSFADVVSGLQTTIADQTTLVASLKNEMEAGMTAALTSSSDFVGSIEQDLDSLESLLKKNSSQQVQALNAQKTFMAKSVEIQEENSVALKKQFLTNVEQLFNDFASSQACSFKQTISQATKHAEEAIEDEKSGLSVAVGKKSSMMQSCKDFLKNAEISSKKQTSVLERGNIQLDSNLAVVGAQISDIETHANSFVSSQVECTKNFVARAAGKINEHMAEEAGFSQSVQDELRFVNLDSAKSWTEAHTMADSVTACMLKFKDQYTSHGKEHTEASKKEKDGLEKSTLHIDAEVDNFVKEELKSDLPTGQTPMKKTFVYPRELQKVEDHDVILEEFRKSPIIEDSAGDDEGDEGEADDEKPNQEGSELPSEKESVEVHETLKIVAEAAGSEIAEALEKENAEVVPNKKNSSRLPMVEIKRSARLASRN